MQNKVLIISLIKNKGYFMGALLLVIGLLIMAPHVAVVQAQATMPAGASWQGYILIEIAPIGPFANGVTDQQKMKLHEAFMMLAREHDSWPPYQLQDTRWRLDNLALIVEARFISVPNKAALAQLVSNRTGYTVAQINSAVTLTAFAFGGSWIESRDACQSYLTAHVAEWETPQ